MIQRLFTFVLFSLVCSSTAHAGSMSSLSNFSARYLGHLNRHATTDIDAGAYNLAGLGFGHPGFSVMIANQSVLRLERLSYREDASEERIDYDATKGVPVIPSLILNYNQGNWGFYAFAGIPAGGGATFDIGHPIFSEFETEAFEFAQQQLIEQGQDPDLIYKVEALDGGSVIAKALVIGATLGGYYKPTDWLSIGVGIRYINGKYSYLANGTYIPHNEHLGPLEVYSQEANVDTVHRAQGFGAVVGMHLQPLEGLDIGIQFHTNTKMKYTYETTSDPTGLFPDGGGRRKDIAPILGMGVGYAITDDLHIASSWTVYLNKFAKLGPTAEGGKSIDNYRTGWEGGLGVEYRVIDSLILRTGFLFSRSAHTEKALSSLTWSFDHVMVGGGLTWLITDWVDLTVGVAQMLPHGGLNESETIDFLVHRTPIGIELGFYL